jgi:hypothetical protein
MVVSLLVHVMVAPVVTDTLPGLNSIFLIDTDAAVGALLLELLLLLQDTITMAVSRMASTPKTASYDKSIILDPLELVNFKFDENITGFKYTPDGIGGNDIIYSPDGIIKSIEDEYHTSQFRFETYKSCDMEESKKMLNKEIEDFSAYTIKLSNVRHQDLSMNGNPAYEVIMNGQGVNIANSIYYIMLIQKEDQVIQFWSIDRDNGKWLEKFKATARSIKL